MTHFQKVSKDTNRQLSMEDIPVADRHSTLLIMRETHIKTSLSYQDTPIRAAKIT